MKLILIFLLLATGQLMAGETCVWEVFPSSFTTAEWDTLKTAAQAKVENMNQPIQKFRVFNQPSGLAIMGDCSIRDLIKVQDAEAHGKIRYIGLYHYTIQGYDRGHPDWKIIKRFFYDIGKSTYTVEGSTTTE